MERDAWILTFVPKRNDTIPLPHRIRALLKYAGRYCGLRSVADIPLRRQVIEQCCAVLCPDCAAGLRVKCDEKGTWWHPLAKTLCAARQLRAAELEKPGRATDAGSVDDSAPVQQVPGAIERRG